MNLDFTDLMQYVFVPMFLYMIYIDRRTTKLESNCFNRDDLTRIYDKLEAITDNIHDLDKKVISNKLNRRRTLFSYFF